MRDVVVRTVVAGVLLLCGLVGLAAQAQPIRGVGRRTTMTVAGQSPVSYSYDNGDRLTAVTQGTASVGLAYDNANRRTSLTLPNGIVVYSTYDDASQLTAMTYKLAGVTIGDLAYGYDASGNRVSMNGSFARTGLPAILTSATYDDANQIATWAGTSVTYDANGNMTSDGTKTYTWNARNELTAISGGISASFAYDGVGRRRSRTVGSTTKEFLYDGLNQVQELIAGTPSANLLTGLAIDEYFTRTEGTGTRHLLTDALGSSIALTDGSGTVQTEYTYEPFGNVTTTGSGTNNTFTFTGREAEGTGSYYYRARYYQPHTGRFLSEDPETFVDGPNNYSYVRNNPVQYVDPLGLEKCECPTDQKKCLEELFKQPVGGVQLQLKPPSQKWAATTRKNKIIIYGSCNSFFDNPSLVLEEYYHVLEQWNKGRLSRIKYAFAYLRHGYDNKYEKEAKTWVSQNIQKYLACLGK